MHGPAFTSVSTYNLAVVLPTDQLCLFPFFGNLFSLILSIINSPMIKGDCFEVGFYWWLLAGHCRVDSTQLFKF